MMDSGFIILVTVGIALLISYTGGKVAPAFHYEVDENQMQVRWGILNQVVNIISWLLVAFGLLALAFFDEQAHNYRPLVIIVAVILVAIFAWYLWEKVNDNIYLLIDKRSGVLIHRGVKIMLVDIIRLELIICPADADTTETVIIYVHLKDGEKKELAALGQSTVSARYMYREVLQKVSEFTNIDYTETKR